MRKKISLAIIFIFTIFAIVIVAVPWQKPNKAIVPLAEREETFPSPKNRLAQEGPSQEKEAPNKLNLDKPENQTKIPVSRSQTPTSSTKNTDSRALTLVPAKEEQEKPSSKRPIVTGSAAFRNKINGALDLLAKKSPYYSRKVTAYLSEIRESNHSGVDVQQAIFHIGKNTYEQQEQIWLASIIVHDAYHVELFRKGKLYYGQEAEALCIAEQKKALQDLGAPASYFAHLAKMLESGFWDIPFEQRNW